MPNLKQPKKSKNYKNNKSILLDFEKDNYTYLAFLKSNGDFYKLIGHSAIFYACEIAEKIHTNANLLKDDDFDHRSKTGVVSIRNFNTITKKLTEIGCKRIPSKQLTDIVAYKLPWKYSEKNYQKLKKLSTLQWQQFNQIVAPVTTLPHLYRQLEELVTAVYHNVRKLPDPLAKQELGVPLLHTCKEAYFAYLELSRGKHPETTSLKHISQHLQMAKNHFKIIAELQLLSVSTCMRLASLLKKAESTTNHELTRRKNESK